MTIGRTLEFHKARSFSLSTVLDQVATPIVLTTGDGLVAHVNQAAEGLLSRADMLRVAQRRIEAVKHDAEIALREAIRASAPAMAAQALPWSTATGGVMSPRSFRFVVPSAAA